MNQRNLSTFSTQIRFILNSENQFIHLSSKRSGFRARVGFITRVAAANDKNAICSLVSNWFGHMFNSTKFGLCGRTI